jgi:hypothetical protein
VIQEQLKLLLAKTFLNLQNKSMKYIIFLVLVAVITLIVSPIIIIKWSDNGMEKLLDGLEEICGIVRH